MGPLPDVPKAVFIASPHTSNWDGPLMIIASFAMGARLNWMGKKEVFRFPFRWILKRLGGVPVDRSKSADRVAQVAAEFDKRDAMFLAIAPSGSRKKSEYWKSGFYHIAVGANVPWLCGCVDFKTRRIGILATIYPSGDMQKDMDAIRETYKGREGRHPERMDPIRLRAEDVPEQHPEELAS